MIRTIFILLLFFNGFAYGKESLDPDEAFDFSLELGNKNSIFLNINISENYYLYKNKIKINFKNKSLKVDFLDLPNGNYHTDEFFGKSEIYENTKKVIIFFTILKKTTYAEIVIEYQGCSREGICFLPQKISKNIFLQHN